MNRQERIELLSRLGEFMKSNNSEWNAVRHSAYLQNPWFIPEFINTAVTNVADNFLKEELLHSWLDRYDFDKKSNAKNIGIVMAGNIPLVGFHDFLCVFASGHRAVIKPSSKDEVLIKHLVEKMSVWNNGIKNEVVFAEQLKGCDAYIATGSNNTSRYFEYYFGKYPNIIRRNRTSVAILDGKEASNELDLLTDDMQLYFGLGCRNITKLYVPENHDFTPLLNALKKYDYFIDYHKYKHNYDYQLALLLMNNKFYMTNGSLLLTENASLFSPVSQINYEYYSNKDEVAQALKSNENVQCIVAHEFISFGKAQSPAITDYADGVDTMEFLKKI